MFKHALMKASADRPQLSPSFRAASLPGSAGSSPERVPEPNAPRSVSGADLRWRTVDIAVAAALGVACGLVFWGFNYVYVVIAPILRDLLPGFASILHALWYFSGPLALLIIRKPGAAVFVNVVGSLTEMVLGNPYPVSSVILSALLQGLASEIPFAVTRYRRFSPAMSVASGALTAFEYGVYLIVTMYQGRSMAYMTIHMISEMVGGILIAGVMGWWLYVAIARTGALYRFASGREVSGDVDQS
ncbi:ECF transporter S component [uncultured Bifidobacterium sp.]|uniref:ECF transporter S component n=1 Tax=uncultured Bifidobacterium sp. TaxID=165187 RepID=UPI00260BF4EC|nr:ECF transporter S component [uncultured Bifidobacterium sp.]